MGSRSINLESLLLDNEPDAGLPGSGEAIAVLKVSVDYNEGGMSYFTGQRSERGYYLHMTTVTRRGGYESFTIGGGLPSVKGLIEPANRFNQKKLEQHASAAKASPLYSQLLDHLRRKGVILSQDGALTACSTVA